MAEIAARVDEGGPPAALFRILIYARRREGGAFDERAFQMLWRIRDEYPGPEPLSMNRVRDIFREQVFLMLLDEVKAMRALPRLLPDDWDRKELVALAERVLTAPGPLSPEQRDRLRQVEALLAEEEESKGETPLRVVPKSGPMSGGTSVADAAREIGKTATRRELAPTDRKAK